MAILWVKRQSGAETDVGEGGRQGFRTEYLVKSSVPTESRTAILLCGGVPVYGAPHPENPVSRCVKVQAAQLKEDPYLWRVTAEWNSNTQDRDPQDEQKQPDLRRPQWTFNFAPLPQYRYRDLDGTPFVDAAGTPFNPPPPLPVYVDEVTISRYQASCNRVFDRSFINSTNTDEWLGAQPNEVLCADISVREVFEFGAYWFAYTYKMLVNPRIVVEDDEVGGWNPHRVLNAGPRMIDWTDPDNPKAIPIIDGGYVDGQPRPLDLDGVPIPWSAGGGFASPPIYLAFRTVNLKAFAPLALVPPWM